jgi:hypothetical protein
MQNKIHIYINFEHYFFKRVILLRLEKEKKINGWIVGEFYDRLVKKLCLQIH